jgi:DnaJ domain/Domain of unknown function (DUF4388)
MQLPGRLRLTSLGDVLGALHRAQASGTLELREERGVTHRIYFAQGMITQVETDLYRQRLGDLLARQGFVGARALARLARRLLEGPTQRVGEILLEEGFVSDEVLSAGLRRQLRSKLDALFQLQDAQLAFRVPRPHEGHRAPLSPGEFLHGRPRARPRARSDASSRSKHSLRASGATPSDAYALLGLRPGADRAAVQQAFRRLARSLHPDSHPHASSEERARLLSRFAELSAAYHALAG